MQGNSISQMTNQHESIAAMFQNEILTYKDVHMRSNVLNHVIKLASYLVQTGNFHAAHGIYSSISSNVLRLKRTFALLPKSSVKKYDQLKHLFSQSGNRVNLRNKIQEYLGRACIPEFSIIVKDLTFVEDGNASTHGNLVNWFKCRKLATIIEQIKMHQNQNTQLFSINKVECAALDYMQFKISSWERLLLTKGDKAIWAEFRQMSRALE